MKHIIIGLIRISLFVLRPFARQPQPVMWKHGGDW